MIEKLECTCIEAYKTRKMRDPNCCACSCDHNDLVEQLAKANERVKELELVIVAITHADETGYVDDVGFVKGWSEVCDETKALINKFAIENQIKALEDCVGVCGFLSCDDSLKSRIKQLRKEQE